MNNKFSLLVRISAAFACVLMISCSKNEKEIEVTMKMDQAAVTIVQGQTAQLSVTIAPTVQDPSLEWTSKDKNIATVDASGLVKGIGIGQTQVTAYYKEKAKLVGCTVTVIKYQEDFGGGKGTQESPYQITSTADLMTFAGILVNKEEKANYIDKYYIQTSDISLSGTSFSPLCPVETEPFLGHYDGGNHSIAGLVLSTASGASGLFAYLGEGSQVSNLKLTGADITSSDANTGGIAGSVDGGQVKNCSFSGEIESSGKMVGGIAGIAKSKAEISGCSVTQSASIYSSYYVKDQSDAVGGILGFQTGSSKVDGCTFEGVVAARGICVGGITGYLETGEVTASVFGAQATASTSACDVGGIIGSIITTSASGEHCLVEGCAAYGDVKGGYSVSGIASHIEPTATSDVVDIINCLYSGGEIVSTSINGYYYALSAGLTGWLGWGQGNFGTVNYVNCAALPGAIYSVGSSALKGCVAGLFGYEGSMTFNVTGCYSNVTADNIRFGYHPISDASFTFYGGIYGRCAVTNTAYSHCYWKSDFQMGPGYSSLVSGKCLNDCLQYNDAQMKDGTLLSKLNASATEYNSKSHAVQAKSWVAGASGYPVIEGLPADPHPVTVKATKVSIIGDSISTFYGYTVGYYYCHYPTDDGSVTRVGQTYWFRLIYEKMTGAELEKNISFSGTVVTRTTNTSYSGEYWYGQDFCKRFIEQGVGNADVIIVHGGTNDYIKDISELYTGYKMTGSAYPTDAEFNTMFAVADAATGSTAVEALDNSTFCTAYIKLVRLIKTNYPSAKVILIIGDYISNGMEKSIIKIADHYGVKYVDLYAVNGFNGITTDPSYNPMPKHDGYCHPDAKAFQFIADKIWTEQGAYLKN